MMKFNGEQNIIANKPNKSFLNNLEILKDKRVEFTGF